LATAEGAAAPPLPPWRRLRSPSLAARLALVTAAVLAVALGMVSAVRTVALRQRLYASTALQMGVDYSTLAKGLRLSPLGVALNGQGYASFLASPTVGALVVDATGSVQGEAPPTSPQYASLFPPVLPRREYLSALAEGRDVSLVAGRGAQRQLVVLAPYLNPFTGTPVAVFELATPVAPLEGTLRQQLEFDLLAGLLALVGAAAAIYVLLGRFLAPLADMARASDQIAAGRLDVALPQPRGDDEVARLSRAFSHMVQRIDVALERERAEQRRVRAFLADASHSLRTPLTVLNGRLDLLLRGESREGEELEAALRALRVEGERMARIVRGLLLLARLDEDAPRDVGSVDLARVLEALRPRLESLAGERRLVLAAPEGLTAWATVEALETIITNLVENAVRHTPEDGQVEVRAEHVGGRVRLRVLDTGTGIAPGDLPRIFDRFYRGARTGQRRDGGAGLGLSIVQRWAQALGGEVEAANRGERPGAVFTVWLPTGPPPASDPRLSRPPG
jgi:two-component system OmpR family sensor kinase